MIATTKTGTPPDWRAGRSSCSAPDTLVTGMSVRVLRLGGCASGQRLGVLACVKVSRVTAAASAEWLPVLDQSVDEVETIQEFADKLGAIIRDVRGIARVVRAVPVVARLGAELVRNWPGEFTSTEGVWVFAEATEPHFFELFARLQDPRDSSVAREEIRESIVGLEDELSCRFAYVQILLRQLKDARGRGRGLRDARQRRAVLQKVLDDVEVAPEVRLVLHQSRLLPVVVILLASAMRRPDIDRSRRMLEHTLREGLDSMIAFLLALVSSPPAAPLSIRDELPEPMALTDYIERWRRVRAQYDSRETGLSLG